MIVAGQLRVDPGEQVIASDQAAEQATSLAQVPVGAPPLLVVRDPTRAGNMRFRVGAVAQEAVPACLSRGIRLQP